jgi:hypothetical protein
MKIFVTTILRGSRWKGTFPTTLDTPLLRKGFGLDTPDDHSFTESLQSDSCVSQRPINARGILTARPQHLPFQVNPRKRIRCSRGSHTGCTSPWPEHSLDVVSIRLLTPQMNFPTDNKGSFLRRQIKQRIIGID